MCVFFKYEHEKVLDELGQTYSKMADLWLDQLSRLELQQRMNSLLLQFWPWPQHVVRLIRQLQTTKHVHTNTLVNVTKKSIWATFQPLQGKKCWNADHVARCHVPCSLCRSCDLINVEQAEKLWGWKLLISHVTQETQGHYQSGHVVLLLPLATNLSSSLCFLSRHFPLCQHVRNELPPY